MRKPPHRRRVASPERWLEYASGDAELARRALQEPMLLPAAYYHAQQAGEKALKGYLVQLGCVRVPRTHDLFELRDAALNANGDEPPVEHLEILDGFPVGIRYPDLLPPAVEEARGAIAAAEALIAFVRERIEAP
jgi:HEPN domain-containing protein